MTGLLNILLPPDKIAMEVGLFFGSFNPVHIGHMAIANYLAEYTSIRQLWFVVSPQNPFKEKEELLNNFDRLELLQQAVGDDPRFRISDVEFHLPKPSYTIDTLALLSKQYPAHRFVILMGADNLENFDRWKNYEKILENYPIKVYPRSGHPSSGSFSHPNISWVKAPLIEISSTFIRESIRAGKDMRHFVPAGVWALIDKMQYYR